MSSFLAHATGFLAFSLQALVCGCGVGPAQATESGSLGNGQFSYGCASKTGDPYCADPSLAGLTFDQISVALGGTFTLSFTSSNSSFPTATPVAVSPDDFLSQSDFFTALRSGTPSFFARTPDGDVLNSVHDSVIDGR
jgi:hypothetical protein